MDLLHFFPFSFFLSPPASLLTSSLFSLFSFFAALVHSFSPSAALPPETGSSSSVSSHPVLYRQRPDLGTAIFWVACSHQASCARGPRSLQSKSQPLSNQELETHLRALTFFLFQSHLIPSLVVLRRLRLRLLLYSLPDGAPFFLFSLFPHPALRLPHLLCVQTLVPSPPRCLSFLQNFFSSITFYLFAAAFLKRYAQPYVDPKAH